MKTFRQIKRIIVGVIGGTVLLIGIALLVLPGPAFIVIPAGLAILSAEFAWAKRWLKKARSWIDNRKSPVNQEQTIKPDMAEAKTVQDQNLPPPGAY